MMSTSRLTRVPTSALPSVVRSNVVGINDTSNQSWPRPETVRDTPSTVIAGQTVYLKPGILPANATVEPTDKSKSRDARQNIIVQATMPICEIDSARPSMFSMEKK